MNRLRDFLNGWVAGFKRVGHAMTTVFNVILLTIAYVIGIGSTAIMSRVLGKKHLDKEINPAATTYWVDHVVKTEPLDKYRRQF